MKPEVDSLKFDRRIQRCLPKEASLYIYIYICIQTLAQNRTAVIKISAYTASKVSARIIVSYNDCIGVVCAFIMKQQIMGCIYHDS